MKRSFDVAIIGAGPAGWAAALQGSKLGLCVALIERSGAVGGACIHTGTVPSKSLRQAILDILAVRRGGELGIRGSFSQPLSVQNLMRRKDAVTERQITTISAFLERNGVEMIRGSASFLSERELRVATVEKEERIEAKHIIIASGSRPRRPNNIPFEAREVVDSDSILELDEIPRSLTVLGGGVIGCEYASMFGALGVRVNLIEKRDELMSFLDPTLRQHLLHQFMDRGMRVMLREETTSVSVEDEGRKRRVVVQLASGRTVRSEYLLAAAGRESNVAALDLDRVGIETQKGGLIKVDTQYRTTQPSIFAVGDVIGFPALAATSMHQGRQAMLHAAGQPAPDYVHLPLAVYTIPEISAVGLSESECRDQGIPYEIGLAHYNENTRGQINGWSDGLLKLVFRRDDHVLVGVHLIGPAASELVHIGLALIHAGGTIDRLTEWVFNYPTLSEAYRVAALDGLNRL